MSTKLAHWQRQIAYREARRLENSIRRWKWLYVRKILRDAIAALSLVIAFTACAEPGWHDVPGARLTPVARPEILSEFAQALENAADEWNLALNYWGCDPAFIVVEPYHIDAHPVTVISEEDWTRENLGAYTSYATFDWGVFDPGYYEYIEIREREVHAGNLHVILLHELGHALGLEDQYTPSDTIMMYRVGFVDGVQSADAINAAIELGCL